MRLLSTKSLLTFDWKGPRRFSLSLPGFIALSLLVHGVAFYVFQIAYPLGATMSAPPAQVVLLGPTSPQNRSILQWIEAEDPAIAFSPSSYIPEELLQSRYQPSYGRPAALPEDLAAGGGELVGPPPLRIADLQPGEQNAAPEPAAKEATTQIEFSGAIARRPLPVTMIAGASSSPSPATFLVGTGPEGRVDYLFKQTSSGDASLDDQAEAHLGQLRFPAKAGAVRWGFATFVWGKEAITQPAPKP